MKNVFSGNPYDAQIAAMGAPPRKPAQDPRALIDGVATKYNVPANLLIALDEASGGKGVTAEQHAKAIAAGVSSGKSVEQVIAETAGDPARAKALMNRAYDIADELYPASAAPTKTPGSSVAGDLGRQLGGSVVKGAGSMVEGLGQGVDAAVNAAGEAVNPIYRAMTGGDIGRTSLGRDAGVAAGDVVRGVGEDIQAGVSPEGRKAMMESTPDGDIFKPSTITLGENPSLRGYAMLGADVLGSLLPVVATAVITKSPAAAAGVGGAMGGGAGAETARDIVQTMAKEVGPDGKSKLEQESALYRELLAGGASPELALDKVTREAERLAFLFTTPISAFGGAATGAILTKPVAGLAGRGIAARVAGKATLSSLEEGIQEAAESMAARYGTGQAAQMPIDITEGTFGDFILGALGGGPVGAIAGIPGQRSPREQTPQEAEPEPLALPAPNNGGTIFGDGPLGAPPRDPTRFERDPNTLSDGSGQGQAAPPLSSPVPPPGADGAAAPLGPISAIAAAAPDLTPVPEVQPVEVPPMFPEMKQGTQVRLQSPDGDIIDAVFQREQEGSAVVRIAGQEVAIDPAAFDAAVQGARLADEEAAAKAKGDKVAKPKAPAKPKAEKPQKQAAPAVPNAVLSRQEAAANEARALEAKAEANGWTEKARKRYDGLIAIAGEAYSPKPSATSDMPDGVGSPARVAQGETFDPETGEITQSSTSEGRANPVVVASGEAPDNGVDGAAGTRERGVALAPEPRPQSSPITTPPSDRIQPDLLGGAETNEAAMAAKERRRREWGRVLGIASNRSDSDETLEGRDVLIRPTKIVIRAKRGAKSDLDFTIDTEGMDRDQIATAIRGGLQTIDRIAPLPDDHVVKTGTKIEDKIGTKSPDNFVQSPEPAETEAGRTLRQAADDMGEPSEKADQIVQDTLREWAEDADTKPGDLPWATLTVVAARLAPRYPEIASRVQDVAKRMEAEEKGRPTPSGMKADAAPAKTGPIVENIREKAAVLRGVAKDSPPKVEGVSLKWDDKEGGYIFSRKHAEKVLQAAKASAAVPTAAEVRAAAAETAKDPSPAQAEAENYKTGKIDWRGITLSIENAKGSLRRKVTPDGKTAWEVKMPAHYGRILGTKGADGDHVDFYMGPNPEADTVYVIDQVDAESRDFDEHKVMIGFKSQADAVNTYGEAFSDGRGLDRIGAVTPMQAEALVGNLKKSRWDGPWSRDLIEDLRAKGKQAFPDEKPALKAEKPPKQAPGASRPYPDFDGKLDGIYEDDRSEDGRFNETRLAFHDATSTLLKATAKILKDAGWTEAKGRDGKPIKPISVDKGNTSNIGDVTMVLAGPTGDTGIYIKFGETTTLQNKPSVMWRINQMKDVYGSGQNEFLDPKGMTPADLAAKIIGAHDRISSRHAQQSAPAQTQPSPVSWKDSKPGDLLSDGSYLARRGIKPKWLADGLGVVLSGNVMMDGPTTWGVTVKAPISAAQVDAAIVEVQAQREKPLDLSPDTKAVDDDAARTQRARDQGADDAAKGRPRKIPGWAVGTPFAADYNAGFDAAQPAPNNEGTPGVLTIKNMRTGKESTVDTRPSQPKPGLLSVLSQEKQDRGAELKAKLAAKARNQTSSGLDPEYITLGGELVALYIEAGTKKFGQMLRDFAETTGLSMREAQAPMRAAYNHVRDDMDLNGEDITGMDSSEQVMAEVRKALAAEATAKPSQKREDRGNIEPEAAPRETPDEPRVDERTGQVGQDRKPQAGGLGNVLAGQSDGNGPDQSLEGSEAGSFGSDGAIRGGASARPRSGRKVSGADGGNDRTGVSTVRRPGASASGLVDAGRGRGKPAVRGRANYRITDPEALFAGGSKARFKKNREALETFQRISDEGREPTPEELDTMAAYIGWGSFGQELFQGTFENRFMVKPEWKDEDAWLRDMLGKEAWQSAQNSIINAHYTDPPTVKAIWAAIEAMGFKGGRVLEPSMGIGNFFGLMPPHLEQASQLTGIELDKTTGGMAKMLYPRANVRIMGYEKSTTPDSFYDLVIGNWPFANFSPADRRYNDLNASLHDYFFVKAVDQVRPGGLVVGITSAFSMDGTKNRNVRLHLAKRAELVASFRLPSGAFEKYAGTKVVTDLVIYRKRDAMIMDTTQERWIKSAPFKTPSGDEINVNQYYIDNPAQVLGTLDYGSGTTYFKSGMIVRRPENIGELLEGIATRVPADAYKALEKRGKEPRFVANNTTDRRFSVTIGADGALYQVLGDQMAALEDVVKYRTSNAAETKAREDQFRRLVDLRRKTGAVMDADRDGASDAEVKRSELKAAYRAFRKAHGTIKDSYASKAMQKLKDPFTGILLALEKTDGTPAAIMERSTVRAARKLDNPTIRDAFVMSRNESLSLDLDRIAEMAKTSVEAVTADLIEAKAIYRVPGGGYQPSDMYLAGNVRQKLAEAREAAAQGEDMAVSIAALEAVQPPDVPYFQIEARFGADWLAPDVNRQFLIETLGIEHKGPDDVKLIRSVSGWRVELSDRVARMRGVSDITGAPTPGKSGTGLSLRRFLEATLNTQSISVTESDGDGGTVKDTKSTDQANAKAGELREKFGEWVWKDPERRFEVERSYNEIMNAVATPQIDGSFMEFPGMALSRGTSPFNLRKHQSDAIWKGILNQRGIYGHEVGTGKTITMTGIAVESRRYGLAKKPLLIAHNANSSAVAAEAQETYPGAKIMYVDNLSPSEIEAQLGRMRTEDWDMIVIPHSLIDRMSLSEDTLMQMAADDIAAYEAEAIAAAQEEGIELTVEDMDGNAKDLTKKLFSSATAKEMVKARNRLIETIRKQAQRASREGAVAFEDLGIDMILVDESHEFKKPPIATRMAVKGLNKGTSDRSLALRFLTNYVKGQRGGTGVHVFTGTPLTNTLTEIYHQMYYAMDDVMRVNRVDTWDGFFKAFANTISDVEVTSTNEYENVERLAAFINVSELRRMAGQYMDIVFADDMPEFKPRTTASGKDMNSKDLTDKDRAELLDGRNDEPQGRPYKKVVHDIGPMGADQKRILQQTVSYARAFKAAGGKARREIMQQGGPDAPIVFNAVPNRASMDARLHEIDAEDDPNSKANRAVKNIARIYHDEPMATQVLFMDEGYSDASVSVKTNKETGEKIKTKKAKFNLAADIVAKLVKEGVKPEEIQIVAGGVTAEQKRAIADKMNKREIRVVIGQTKTLGVGVNMQKYLRAMHHLDAPWMPGDLEQRNGRGQRQGNTWNTVYEYRYLTESLDGRRWQVLAIKDRFIKAFLKAKEGLRTIEGDAADDSESMDSSSLGDTLAEAAGDPRLMQANKLEKRIEKLQSRERIHSQGIADAISKAKRLRTMAEQEEAELPPRREDAAHVRALRESSSFTATVNGKTYDNRPEAEAAIEAYLPQAGLRIGRGVTQKLAVEVNGFTVEGQVGQYASMGNVEFRILRSGTYYIGKPSLSSIEGAIRRIPDRLADAEASIEDTRKQADRLDAMAKEPFQQQKDLDQKKADLEKLKKDMQDNPVPAPVWLRQGAPIDTLIFVDGKERVVTGHRWTESGWFVATEQGDVDYADAKDQFGMPLYEVIPFEAPEVLEGSKAILGDEADGGGAEMREDAEPVATLTGNELGAWEDIRQLGRKVEAWYRDNLIGKTVVHGATGMEVHFRREGGRKVSGRKGDVLMRIVPALREIIADGTLTNTEADTKGNRDVKAWHTISATVMLDGKPRDVVVKIKETADGSFHYDLSRDMSDGARQMVASGRDGDTAIGLEDNPVNLNLQLFSPEINGDDALITDEEIRRITRDMNAELAASGLAGKVSVRVVRRLISNVTGNTIQGRFNEGPGSIEVRAGAMAGERGVMRHEIIHALRSEALWNRPGGLFTPAEWRELARAAQAEPEIVASVKARYPNLDRPAQIEEMVAELYRLWAEQRDGYDGVAKALAKVEAFIVAMANLLRGRGFVSAARTMEQIAGGKIGGRGPQGPGGGRRGAMKTDTPAFKRWFGDSKVVDAAGKPRMVYHGTSSDFGAFNKDLASRAQGGFFFASAPDMASGYAAGEGGNVIPVYLSMQNPLVKDMEGLSYRRVGISSLIRQAKDQGHDGVIIQNVRDADLPTDVFIAMEPTQIKSAFNDGGFDPANPNMSEMRAIPGTVRDKFKGLVGFRNWRDPKEVLRNLTTDMMTGDNMSLLALVPGRALFAEMGGKMLSTKRYIRAKEEMDTLRNDWHAKAAEVAQKWIDMQKKDPAANEAMMDLMHRSTLTGVDPSRPDPWGTGDNLLKSAQMEWSKLGANAPDWAKQKVSDFEKRKKTYATIKGLYDALPPEYQAFYGEVKDSYEKLADDFDQALEDNIKAGAKIALKRAEKEHRKTLRQIEDDGLTGEERADAIDAAEAALAKVRARAETGAASQIKAMRKVFEGQRLKGPYFPLARFGDYFVTVRDEDGKVINFSRFESEKRQQVFKAEQEALHPGRVSFGLVSKKGDMRDQVDPKFVSDVEMLLADSGASAEVMDAIWQRYLETMPDQSIRTSKIHRKGREGFNRDALRSYTSHTFHGAHQLARLKYGLELQDSLDDAQDEARLADDPNRATALVNEMRKRMDWTMNPTGSSWSAAASSLAFVWYLGVSPAAAVVNLTQTTVIGPSVFVAGLKSATYGKAIAALGRAAKDFGQGQGVSWKDTWSAENAPGLSADEKAAMQEGYRRGTIDKTQAHDLAAVAESGVEFNPFREKWMKRIGFAFHHAERVNREVTFLAAYRLSRADGLQHADAVEKASDLTWKTHFSYQNSDRPRFMQGDIPKVLFIFRQFSVNLLYRLFRDAHQSLAGATKAERKEARTQLVGISLSMMAHAGIKGVWGYGLLMMLLGMFVPGADDDDIEEWLQDALLMEGDGLGVAAANYAIGAFLNGVPGQLTGAALTERVGSPNLWFRGSDRNLEGEDVVQHYINELAGPIGGIVYSVFGRGIPALAEGEVVRGVEALTPKFVRDVVRTGRFATEGATTRNGDTLIEDVSPWELMLQANGFTPARLAERYDMNTRLKNKEKEITDERKDLHRAASDAIKEGQPIPEKVMDKIRDFNRRFPEYPITGDTIKQSYRGRMRAAERNEFGVSLNPRLNDRLRGELAPAVYN